MTNQRLEQKTFLWLLVAVTVAFIWVLLPFYGAVFWAVILALLFTPLRRRIQRRMPQRRNMASLLTELVVLLIVVLPVSVISILLAQEAASIVQMVRGGQVDFGHYYEQVLHALPRWAQDLLGRLGLSDVGALRTRAAASVSQGVQAIGSRALVFGQNAFDFIVSFFVMLYLLFFLLRDGGALAERIREAIPLRPDHKQQLLEKFTTVTKATVKGNIIVAAVQGLLGGIAFWFLDVHGAVLWGTLMAFLSLLPAVGAGLVWGPVAIWFLATGKTMEGLGLIVWGAVVIGLVDNLLRPLLVGKDTRMPDYVVLISTIGGMALFGINGFVIGPVVAAMFISGWELFTRLRREQNAQAPEQADQPVLDAPQPQPRRRG